MGAGLKVLLRSGVLVLVGLAFGATFVLLGIAGVTLRAQCQGEWSLVGCVPAVDTMTTGTVGAPVAVAVARRDPLPHLSGRDRVLQAADIWIGDTFEVLSELPEQAARVAGPTPVAAAGGAETRTVVSRRSVPSVKVDGNGQPILPSAAVRAASDAVEPAQPDPPETAAVAFAPVPRMRPAGLGITGPAVEAEPEPPSEEQPASAAAAGSTRTVLGEGANVRSGPSTASGKVFALSGGAAVTVTDTERGWHRITDAKGRSGWVYGRYVSGS